MGLRLPHTMSPSKMSLFKDCALAFRYSAVDRLAEPPSVAATRGTLVHRVLELLHLDPPLDRGRDRAEQHLATAWTEMSTHPDLVGLDLEPEELDRMRDDAGALVDRYFALEDPTAVAAVGIEVMLAADVGRVRLRGILDRLELADDGLVVTDYKTGRSPSLHDERARLLGVTVYAYLCRQVLGTTPVRVQLMYLANTETIIAEPTDQALRGLENQVGAIWDAVVRACRDEDFRPRPSRRCDWCGYRPICPAHGGAGPDPDSGDQLRLFDE
jgi:putative RecB family exonuclease